MATEYLIGNVKGPQGATGQTGSAGISIINSVIDTNGHLIVTLSNGQTIDTGVAKGNKGDTGAKGEQGTIGPTGAQGEQGIQGPKGNPATVNGKAGESIILKAVDIGIDAISGLAAVNTQSALAEVASQLSNKAPLASPNFTGTPKIAGKEIPTTETGTWTPNIIVANNIITTTHKAVGKWIKVGIEWLITLDTSITFSKATAPQYTIDGLPIVFPSGTPVNIADAFNGASAHGNYGFIADGKIRVFPGENATLVQNKSTLYISIKGYGI